MQQHAQGQQQQQQMREPSSMDDQDNDGDERAYKKPRRNWTRGQAACTRCRKKKTKCSGTVPCERCIRLEVAHECTFEEGSNQSSVYDRIRALEDCVQTLMQSTPGAGQAQEGLPRNAALSPRSILASIQTKIASPANMPILASPSNAIPPIVTQQALVGASAPTSYAHLDPSPGSLSASSTRLAFQDPYIPPSSASRPLPPSVQSGGGTVQPSHLQKAPAATSERFEPPFAEVVFNRSVYQAAEISRAASPVSFMPFDPSNQSPAEKDVVTAGIIPVETASRLYDIFVGKCLPYLPLLGGSVTVPNLEELRQRSPFLSSCCVAIGSRFAASIHLAGQIPYTNIVDHAENLLGRTLLRKRHTLEDVQAAVLMSAWGLHGKGEGPDAWMLASHAYAMSARLGLNVAPPAGKQPDQRDIEKARAWMLACAFETFQSVGFGRPGGRTIATTEALLDMLRFHSATSGDIFVLALAELAAISEHLVQWQDDMRSERTTLAAIELFDKVLPLLKDWSSKWTNANSRYICGSTPIARLYGEHVYLCLALLALKSVKTPPVTGNGALPVDHDTQLAVMKYMSTANQAASAIIRVGTDAGIDSATTFGNDYCTLILAQAALAILSLAGSKHRLEYLTHQQQVDLAIDEGGACYLVRQVVSALAENDFGHTRIASFLSTTLNNALEQFSKAPSRRSTSQASFSSQGAQSNNIMDTNDLSALPPIAEGLTEDQWQPQSWFTDFFSNQTDWLVSEQEGSNLLAQPSFMNLWWGEQQT